MSLLTLGLIQFLIAAPISQAAVSGTVVDAETATPLAGAAVTLTDVARSVATDASGHYAFLQVPPGPRQITVRCVGYAPRSILALVPPGGALEINLSLAPEPVLLHAVEVRARVPVRGAEPADSDAFSDRVLSAAAIQNHAVLAEPDAFGALGGGDVVLEPESPSGIHIRGGSSDETAYLLDGVPVFSPFHASGMTSAWNPDALSGVAIVSSAPSENDPHALSGVVEATTRSPGLRPHTSASLSSTQARFTLDGPLTAAGAGYLISVRSGLQDAIAPNEPSYLKGGIGDWLAKLETRAPGGHMRFLVYENRNRVGAAATNEDSSGRIPERNVFEWRSRSAGVEWRHDATRRTLRVLGWGAEENAHSAWEGTSGPLRMENAHRDLGLLAEVVHRARATTVAEIRVEQITSFYRVESGAGTPWQLDGQLPLATVLLQQARPLGSRLALDYGASIAPTGRELNFGPHARVRWDASPRLSISGSYVRSHQFSQSLRNSESVAGNLFPVDVFVSAGAGGVPVARGDLGTLVAEFQPRAGLRFSVQGYARGSDGMILVAPREAEPFSTGAFTLGGTESQGVSGEAAVSSTRWGLNASYGWQRVRYEHGDSSYVPDHGAAHHLEAGLIAFVTRTLSLRAGATAILTRRATIVPGPFEWTPPSLLNRGGEFVGTPHYGNQPLGSTALPAYVRLDLGARKHWSLRTGEHRASIELFGTASNVLGRRNVLTYALNSATGRLSAIELGAPTLLVAGLDWRY